MNEKKKFVTEALMNIEPMPLTESKHTDLSEYTKIPFGKIASLGTFLMPFTKTVQETVTSGDGNLYRLVDDFGRAVTNTFARKDGFGVTQTYKDLEGSFRNARLVNANIPATITTCAYNPAMLFMAATMVSMEKELSDIKEAQQHIIDFLNDNKTAELKGDLLFLGDTISNYQYNLDSDTYKTNAHIKVWDIEQNARRNIVFYTKQIERLIDKKDLIVSSQSVRHLVDKLQPEFTNYKLALYLYGFASFLNVLLLENFNQDYLDSLTTRLQDYSYQYRELYTKCYNFIEENTEKSIDAAISEKVADASKAIGNFVAKIPIISKSQLDENLIKTHDTIDSHRLSQSTQLTERLLENRDGGIQTFIDTLCRINQMYNQPTEILFDSDGMYIKLVA